MRRAAVVSLVLLGAAAPALAADPLAQGNLRKHIAGPELEPGSLEGKVVLLEYFGFR